MTLGWAVLFLVKIMGPKPGITRLEMDSVIFKSVDRILTAFDDVVQVGLIKLRLSEIGVLN